MMKFVTRKPLASVLITGFLLTSVSEIALASTDHVSSMRTHAPSSRDVNGVNLGTGQFMPPPVSVTIGSSTSNLSESITGSDFPTGSVLAGGITFADPYSYANETQFALTVNKDETYVRIYFGGYNKTFLCSSNVCAADDGSMDSLEGGTEPTGFFHGAVKLTTSDGTIAHFNGLQPVSPYSYVMPSDMGVDARFAILTKLVKPDGETVHIVYDQTQVQSGYDSSAQLMGRPPEFYVKSYVSNVYSSAGFSMWGSSTDAWSVYTLTNQSAPSGSNADVTIGGTGGLSGEYPFGQFQNGSIVTISDIYYYWDMRQIKGLMVSLSGENDSYYYHEKVEDRYRNICEDNFGGPGEYTFTGNRTADIFIPLPNGFADCIEASFDRYLHQVKIKNTSGSVRTLVDYYLPIDSVVWSQLGFLGGCRGQTARGASETCVRQVTRGGGVWKYTWSRVAGMIDRWQVDIEDPDGNHRIVQTSYDVVMGTRIHSDTNEAGQTTLYEYADGVHLTKVTFPEGNYVTYEYDRNRLTYVREYPKAGSTPKVTQASYPSTCTETTAKVCNKPVWVRDALGKQTDYTYDPAHGGVLTETGPADANGVRPQMRYTYTQYTAPLAMVPNTPNIWRLTKVSTCLTATSGNPASCVGTADEQITEFAYAHPNLFLTSETKRNGNNTVSTTTSYGYDWIGNTVMVDGPRTDVDDTAYKTYDSRRRPILEIGADPDGGGALKRPTVKHYYDVDGLETRTETGTCGTVTMSGGIPTGCSDFVWTSAKKMTYDAVGRLTKTEVVQP
ncbi:hypothetical protein [Asticcacaulis tiandongensis]|uniref:hypothetical protein n=1 Tax=Asticcacaulis tiandongensis TaxID=2565365 RepID=UPI00112C66F6|nr:hypothetical protein [Asticcacaulis tiandongensis]